MLINKAQSASILRYWLRGVIEYEMGHRGNVKGRRANGRTRSSFPLTISKDCVCPFVLC